ncbi:MAG: hypothetical protein OXR67_16780 [Chloroflexota bacterium]|nr:hypothetical protein [Chloroflexota bacterium]
MRLYVKCKFFFLLALLVPTFLLAAACGASAPAAPGEPSAAIEKEPSQVGPESVVAVSFVNDVMTPETIQVKQGHNVTLNLETDRPGSFHIHGYDLQQETVVGEVTQFQFVANATGRFRINFHGVAEPTNGMAAGMDQGSNVAEASMSNMNNAGGGHDAAAMGSGASVGHGPAESALPVSMGISAEVAEDGGVHVAINTVGWRWAPEKVNEVNSDGAGHAHIYADGVKLSRVYGNYHYIPALEPGTREIKVNLNSNDHSELTWQGDLLEASVTVTIPEIMPMSHQDTASTTGPVEAEAPMSLRMDVHEDLLGGYNLQVEPTGFTFSQSIAQGHEAGAGYAQLSINGEVFNRLYAPWLQVPAQGEGMHTFTVSLLNNEGQPYQHNGQPVEMSVTVHEEAKAEDGDGPAAGHHDTGPSQQATVGHHGTGPDAAAAVPSDHHGGAGASGDHHGGGASGSAEVVEFEIGYLEVLP